MSAVHIDDTEDCPEFFEIAVDGDKSRTKWIFYSGDASYLVGTFDGTTFTPESGPHKLNLGNSFYASQTFNNIPGQDGRRILMAHAGGGGDGVGFWGAIGLPAELTLRTTDEGLRLFTYPVRELEALRVKTHDIAPQPLKPGVNPLAGVKGELIEVVGDVVVGDAGKITFDLRGIPVVYDVKKQELICQNRPVPLKTVDGRIRLRAYLDRTSITIFANDGRAYMPMGATPPAENLGLGLSAVGEGALIHSLQVHELASIWK
jgi:sucrose-6-phosphate hydrolase SacC (GH32 family)